jgi:hypothetical protein
MRFIMKIMTPVTLLILLISGCTSLPPALQPCGENERAVLAEFPLYANEPARPEYNPSHPGCVLGYSTTSAPEEVLTYFAQQLEAHGWKGAPQFGTGEYEISAYRERYGYGVRVGEGFISGQELAPGSNIINVIVLEREDTQVVKDEPPVNAARVEMSKEELLRFVGEYTASERVSTNLQGDRRVEAVVTLAEGGLQIRRPGRLSNSLIPVGPTQFCIKDFCHAYAVEFEIVDGKVESMMLYQQMTDLHIAAGSMHAQVELLPLQ